ncbi:MAG: VTT domain-containing protein [Verrucomicrobiota bacterium]
MIQPFIDSFRDIHSAWFIAVMVFLPLVGFPISPFWILAGIRFGPVMGILVSVFALAANDAIAYQMASRWLKRPIQTWLAKRAYRLPQMNDGGEIRLLLICRLTPGFPLPAQNYLLGCSGIHFVRYLVWSLPLQAVWAIAFVVFGDAVTRSNIWPFVLAASLLIVVALVIAMLRSHLLPPKAPDINAFTPQTKV